MNSNNHSEHLQFIYNRLTQVHNENPNLDYMVKLNHIIEYIQQEEQSFNDYMEYYRKSNNVDYTDKHDNPDLNGFRGH